ncbi:hypothetical protein IAQ61_009210 [Plenodomus lingam]|uniref:Similar to acetylxylan esterase n=1 Tax=Leptosphaeria maculans (strain JN3 / isolate v23.1.3 / race Av1-4-5-6-7-8) TaxID=985895 RepID=E4ZPY5_LEPMJ|nr:similar to acetylxylan esterase [Plenodomus lingam JN3]KAH9865263.1 hypothetical protein IAQ61_009210 [Plenodomus lingam]CBX93520.1 similar to acetylxylan esterase [Plenodomus lingam JN3]
MKFTVTATALFASLAAAAAAPQKCHNVYIVGARETLALQENGFGTAAGLVEDVKKAYPGTRADAIKYPACAGQASCGGIDLPNSLKQGTKAVVTAVNEYNKKCPQAKIVLIGYSQGGQLMENALCGSADPNEETINPKALPAVKAAILLGPISFRSDLTYSRGTCRKGGITARPAGYTCSPGKPGIIRSYCDATDQFCCSGKNLPIHSTYVTTYGDDALKFIKQAVDRKN